MKKIAIKKEISTYDGDTSLLFSIRKSPLSFIFDCNNSNMFTKEEAFSKISELTERFAEQIVSYKKSDYNK